MSKPVWKPREWWLFGGMDGKNLSRGSYRNENPNADTAYTRVIEKSAYDKAVAALKDCQCSCRLFKEGEAPKPNIPFVGQTEIALCPKCATLRELGEIE